MMIVSVSQYHGVPLELEKIGIACTVPCAGVATPGGCPTFWNPTWPLVAGMIVARMRTISPKPRVTMAR